VSGYYNYFHFGLSAYADRVLLKVRERVYRTFLTAFAPTAKETILDVGVSNDSHISANYLEKNYPYPKSIVALSLKPYPGVTQICGDGRTLPFADNSIDYVYSHAVIEHTGNRKSQARFAAEAYRVARKGVLLTTPNRTHPVETHTGLPLLHYLPAAIYRPIYARLGKSMYAKEETLNLLSRTELATVLATARIPRSQIEYQNIRWLGVTSNLVAVIRKPTDRWQP
jgi:hypothetical protein